MVEEEKQQLVTVGSSSEIEEQCKFLEVKINTFEAKGRDYLIELSQTVIKSKYQTPGTEKNSSEFYSSTQFEDFQKLIENFRLVKAHVPIELKEYFFALSSQQ